MTQGRPLRNSIKDIVGNFEKTIDGNNAFGGSSGMYLSSIASSDKTASRRGSSITMSMGKSHHNPKSIHRGDSTVTTMTIDESSNDTGGDWALFDDPAPNNAFPDNAFPDNNGTGMTSSDTFGEFDDWDWDAMDAPKGNTVPISKKAQASLNDHLLGNSPSGKPLTESASVGDHGSRRRTKKPASSNASLSGNSVSSTREELHSVNVRRRKAMRKSRSPPTGQLRKRGESCDQISELKLSRASNSPVPNRRHTQVKKSISVDQICSDFSTGLPKLYSGEEKP